MATKLVRDKIQTVPGFIRCSSDTFRPVRDRREHEALLLKKIQEELGELLEAHEVGVSSDVIGEGGDLIEAVFSFLLIRTGVRPPVVEANIYAKIAEKGGFTGGLVWEHP